MESPVAHERVYHPETGEAFDVVASRAVKLRLEQGWSATPWRREAPSVPEPVVDPVVREAPRGRGRRRFEEAAPVEVETTPQEDVAVDPIAEEDVAAPAAD